MNGVGRAAAVTPESQRLEERQQRERSRREGKPPEKYPGEQQHRGDEIEAVTEATETHLLDERA